MKCCCVNIALEASVPAVLQLKIRAFHNKYLQDAVKLLANFLSNISFPPVSQETAIAAKVPSP